MSALDERLSKIACTPVLMVACDYDGTLAPIVNNPAEARPLRESIIALRQLAALPQTHVAVISGRALHDLAQFTGLPDEVHLVGSHGSEFDPNFATSLAPEVIELRDRVIEEIDEIASKHEGLSVEPKPAGVALHYRNADETESERALDAVREGPANLSGVFTKHGKKVLELGVVSTNKGKALQTMRHRAGATAVIFLGDDVTDEDAFNTLTGPDIAVKIGPGETAATERIDGPQDVARVLAVLAERRAEWLAGSAAVPIEDHSMLSDQRTIALVTPDARIAWMCMPRIDGDAVFAELLGGPAAGRFVIADAGGAAPTGQEYTNHSLVLRTNWPTFSVTDFLDCTAGRPTQRAGRVDLIRVIEGAGRVRIEFAPRLDFSRVPTRLQAREDGGLVVEDTLDPIVLRAPGVQWTINEEGEHHTATAEVELGEGPLALEMRCGTGSLRPTSVSPIDRLSLTERYWSSWADQLELPSVAPDLVRTSALVLRGLIYGPTGAVSAAGTMSLPEHIGGVRNWDYRYCWLRDAAMAAASLVRLGSFAEAMHLLGWICGVVEMCCESPERIQPLYTVTGGPLGTEGEISELSGYRGSRPVRVSNAAARQVQLDVFGPIVELVALLADHDAPLSSEHWRLVEAMVLAVQRRWREPDHGIWEIRRPRRHHVHSKVMCWCTVDRAARIAELFLGHSRDDWRALRDEIAEDVLTHGFNAELNTFTAAYDDTDLDAAALHVGLSGLLRCDDDRFSGTVNAIEKGLLEGPTVYRYRADDGLPGFEGGFHLCFAWLIQSYIALGRCDEAQKRFQDMLALTGPTGMLPEQYHPRDDHGLGNTPQAYSHIGIIDTAILLDNCGD